MTNANAPTYRSTTFTGSQPTDSLVNYSMSFQF